MLIDERRELKVVDRGETHNMRSREFPTGGERGRVQTEMGIGDDDQNQDERGLERKSGGLGKGGGGAGGVRSVVIGCG